MSKADFNPRLVEDSNRAVYGSVSVARRYARVGTLQEAERVILAKIAPAIRGKRILDIGVGSGRTTAHLRTLSNDYVGIDYSVAMVEAARRKTGISSIYCCNAEDMRRFADEAFDFVLFSFNGLDYMPHQGRLRALSEIYRVLNRGGYFLFSSHNRLCDAARPPWRRSNREFSLHFAKDCLKTFLALPRRWRLRKYELQEDEYAIVNDPALGYSLMTYYIDLSSQLSQLATIGFVQIEAFDSRGRPTRADHDSPWVHYLARK